MNFKKIILDFKCQIGGEFFTNSDILPKNYEEIFGYDDFPRLRRFFDGVKAFYEWLSGIAHDESADDVCGSLSRLWENWESLEGLFYDLDCNDRAIIVDGEWAPYDVARECMAWVADDIRWFFLEFEYSDLFLTSSQIEKIEIWTRF